MMNHVLGGKAIQHREAVIPPAPSDAVLTVEQLSVLAHLQAKSINRLSGQVREIHQLLVEQSIIIKEQAALIDRLERGV